MEFLADVLHYTFIAAGITAFILGVMFTILGLSAFGDRLGRNIARFTTEKKFCSHCGHKAHIVRCRSNMIRHAPGPRPLYLAATQKDCGCNH